MEEALVNATARSPAAAGAVHLRPLPYVKHVEPSLSALAGFRAELQVLAISGNSASPIRRMLGHLLAQKRCG